MTKNPKAKRGASVVKLVRGTKYATDPKITDDLSAAFRALISSVCLNLSEREDSGVPERCRDFLRAFDAYQASSGDRSGGFPVKHFDFHSHREDEGENATNAVRRGVLSMVAGLMDDPKASVEGESEHYNRGHAQLATGVATLANLAKRNRTIPGR
jgi:hypothetical protein